MKERIVLQLEELESRLKALRGLVSASSAEFVSRKGLKAAAKEIAIIWFEKIEKNLTPSFQITPETVAVYHELFSKLLSFSQSAIVRKKTYINTLNKITSGFNKDIFLPVLKFGEATKLVSLSNLLELVNSSEKEYLKEAVTCAQHGHYRASIVLGWCAAIDRMQKMVRKKGFKEFSRKSKELHGIKEGRYKRFGKKLSITNMSELQSTVFDNDLLWILEYWGIIDANEHDRLSICFTMRNNCAHPSEAPLTEENLLSFFSDLNKIVFSNPKFAVEVSHL